MIRKIGHPHKFCDECRPIIRRLIWALKYPPKKRYCIMCDIELIGHYNEKYCKECRPLILLMQHIHNTDIYRKNNREKCLVRNRKYYKKYKKLYAWKYVYSWIKTRCNNKNSKPYQRYGAKGIKCFLTQNDVKYLWFRDNANKMKEPHIHRKNNDKDYTIDNCEFIEKEEHEKIHGHIWTKTKQQGDKK